MLADASYFNSLFSYREIYGETYSLVKSLTILLCFEGYLLNACIF